MSILAATLANSGISPVTEDVVFSSQTVKNCLSLMYSCGMYDFSGEFAFTVGLPAKSGVSGAMIIVIPNVLGISIWSPRLDQLGNTVRGIAFCKKLISTFNFHNYDSLTRNCNKIDPRLKKNENKAKETISIFMAANQGDLHEIRRLQACGVDLNQSDYDGRTALHLAASEGNINVVKFLLAKGVEINPKDRWGHTPLEEALNNKYSDIVKILEKHV